LDTWARFYSSQILTVLKDVISSEKMFDEKNPSVIICSKPMEQALDQKALHVTEVRSVYLLTKHVSYLSNGQYIYSRQSKTVEHLNKCQNNHKLCHEQIFAI
jgi:hypothetical protein